MILESAFNDAAGAIATFAIIMLTLTLQASSAKWLARVLKIEN
ncbi:hypothetical protein [Caloramator mitchellensis]|nr:hypothetical protein [Caloramator mitchellensis]